MSEVLINGVLVLLSGITWWVENTDEYIGGVY